MIFHFTTRKGPVDFQLWRRNITKSLNRFIQQVSYKQWFLRITLSTGIISTVSTMSQPEKCLESFYSALDRVVEEPETVKAWPNLLRERFGAAFHHVLCGFLDLHVPAAAGIMGPHPLNFDIDVCVCRKLSSELCQDRLTAVCERVCVCTSRGWSVTEPGVSVKHHRSPSVTTNTAM